MSNRRKMLIKFGENFSPFLMNIQNEYEMEALGGRLADRLRPPFLLFLQGELGAGKTTLVRGFLRALGHEGKVKSPTYTLVESYEFQNTLIHHFDLYRLIHPAELEERGFRDYLHSNSLCLLEWPEKGGLLLPEPDLVCHIDFIAQYRKVTFKAGSERGQAVIDAEFL